MFGVGLGRPAIDDVRDDGLLRRRQLALVLGQAILTPTTVSSLAAARAALEQLEVADKANSRPSETVDLDEDVVARNTLAETNIARSTSRASNDSNRISIASQEDFKF